MKKLHKVIASILFASLITGCVQNNDKSKVNNDNKNIENSTNDNIKEDSLNAGELITDNHKIEDEPRYGTPIVISYNGGICAGAPNIADIRGEFKERGIEVEYVSGESNVDALGTGKADASVGHITKFIPPTLNGVNMIFTSGAHTGCKSLYVLNDRKIESTKDLVGKTVGFPEPIGASDQNIALRFFHKDNIGVDEVKYKQVELSAIIQSLEKGEIQGAILTDEYADKFLKDGTLKRIRSLTWDDDFKNETCCVNAMNADFVEENPLMAKLYNEAVIETQIWIEEHPEEAAKILYDNNWASGDFDASVRMLDSYNWNVTFENTSNTFKTGFNEYKEMGIIKTEMDSDEFLKNYWQTIGLKDSDFK